MNPFIRSAMIWGDSILKGVIFNPDKHKYTLLGENSAFSIVARQLAMTLHNHSKMGRTINHGSSVVTDYFANDGIVCDAALVSFGGNDCNFRWDEVVANPDAEHLPQTTPEMFTSQLRAIIARVREHGMTPLLMTLPPLHAEKFFDFITRDKEGGSGSHDMRRNKIFHWLGSDIQFIYRWHERYNRLITKIAAETRSSIVEVRDAFLKDRHYDALICEDGMHPNEKGQQRMAETFLNYISGRYGNAAFIRS